MKKEAYYFSHDANARNDIKILKVRRALGLEGYAIYFCIIEMLRDQSEYKLPIDSLQDIAFDLQTSEEKVKTIVHSFDLFIIEENHFFSNRLLVSMTQYNELKSKLSEAGRKGGLISAEVRLNHPSSIKGKERKGNKKKRSDFSDEKNTVTQYKPPKDSNAAENGMVY